MHKNRFLFKGSLDYPDLYSIGDKSLSCNYNYFNFIHNARDNFDVSMQRNNQHNSQCHSMANFAREHGWIVSPFSGNEATHLPQSHPPSPRRKKRKDPRERQILSLRGSRTKLNEIAKHVTLQTSTSAGAEDILNGQKRRSLKTSLPNCQFCELLFSQMDDFIA